MNTKVRVKVWSDDKERDLRFGTLEGYVTVFFVKLPGGALIPLPGAEIRPTKTEVAALNPQRGMLVEWPGAPKIRLDSGQVIYGCLVHWAPIQEEPRLDSSSLTATGHG
jgi:hypothetical protein